jgi:hypothetical protein
VEQHFDEKGMVTPKKPSTRKTSTKKKKVKRKKEKSLWDVLFG